MLGTPTAYLATAFAIRTCSLLTSRRARFQSTLAHFVASSRGAPAEAVFCFPIREGSPDSLAMEHLSDVGTRFAEVVGALDFRVEPCCRLYPLDFRAAFALPTSPCRPSLGLPYGRLARRRAWRTDGFSAFLTIASDNLGGTWTPVALQSSCRDVRDLHLGHACKHWEACLRPLSSRRSERA